MKSLSLGLSFVWPYRRIKNSETVIRSLEKCGQGLRLRDEDFELQSF